MRLNLFTYHVQDRDYSKEEVLKLINEESYFKHLLISNNTYSYSAGTIAETFMGLIKRIGDTFVSIMDTVDEMFSDKSVYESQQENIYKRAAEKLLVGKYKISDLKGEGYSGREITAFMNKFYNYVIKYNAQAYYDNIVTSFINHEFADTDVPTLGNSSYHDIAVLDIQPAA